MAKPTGYGGRDMPDFGISDTFQTKSILTDLGELASRLGAPNVFDRTGSLIWAEQFQYGFNTWILSSAGNGISPYLVAHPYLYKPYAVKLSGSAGDTGLSQMQVYLPFPYESPLGIEFAYNPNVRATELEFYGEMYTGSYRYVFDVRFRLLTGEIHVMTTGGAMQEIYNEPVGYRIPDIYNITKVVLDLSAKEYSRVMFNKYDISAKGIVFHHNTSTLGPRMTLLFRLESAATYDEHILIDNIIFTLDEPI